MIQQVDRRLQDWVGSLLPGVAVSLNAPADAMTATEVNVYCFDIHPSHAIDGPRCLPLQVLLRYLVTTRSESPEQAHAMLSTLLFAAMQDRAWEVEIQPLVAAHWSAFGVVPRPSFFLRVPLRFERGQEAARMIEGSLELLRRPMAPVSGVLLGHNEQPIANARVEVPGHALAASTDDKGRFSFHALPLGALRQGFVVQARGRRFVGQADPDVDQGRPLIIHINTDEA